MLRRLIGCALICLGVAQGSTASPIMKFYSPEVACGNASASLRARDGCSPVPPVRFDPAPPVVASPGPAPAPGAESGPEPETVPAAADLPLPETPGADAAGPGFAVLDWRALQLQLWLKSLRRPSSPGPAPSAPTPDGPEEPAGTPGPGDLPPTTEDILPGDGTGGIITGILDPDLPDIPDDGGLVEYQPQNPGGEPGTTPGDGAPGDVSGPARPPYPVAVDAPDMPTAMPTPASSLLLAAGALALAHRRRRRAY